METDKQPVDIILELIKLNFSRTVKGDEVCGYRIDDKTVYLNSAECRKLAAAFDRLAYHIDNSLIR